MGRWILLAAGVGSALAAAVAARLWWDERGTAAVGAQPPSVVLITLDTTRADRLGSYGFSTAATPHLDRLSASGVRFERAVSPAPLTLPAHASLMTARNPYSHGVRNNGHFSLPEDVPTLAAQFDAAGYDTAGFVSSFVLDRQFGLARGFAHYDDTLDPAPSSAAAASELERRGDRTVQTAIAWLEARAARHREAVSAASSTRSGRPIGGRPYFLWVHLYDPHEPYAAPDPFAARFPGQPYDAELAFVDASMGELLAAIERIETGGRPLVVVTADHGESLGDHGERAHGLFVYEAAIRVPLIVSWPGNLTPRVVTTPVRLIDIAPTVLSLAGLPAPPGIDGRDVSVLARTGAEPAAGASAYAETYFPEFFMGWSPLRAIDDGRWKYIDSPEPELYDLEIDPGETRNRVAAEPGTARALRRQLEETVRGALQSAAMPTSAETQRKLAALGYVSTPTARHAGAGPAPVPARMVGVFERLASGNRALADGRADEAVRIARAALDQDGGNAFAYLLVGRGLLATGAAADAIAAFGAYLARVPTSADAHHWLALAHLRQGNRARALAEEEAAVAIDPRHAAAIALRAGLLFSSGRREEGVAALATAVSAQPSNLTLRTDYADLLADAGRMSDAEAQYRRVLDLRADDLRARAGLGTLLAKLGRLEPAIAELTRVLAAEPGHEEARIERAAAYARAGRAADSRADLEHLTGPGVRPDIRRSARRELGRGR
jgi:choline-sulfatase